MGKITVLYLAVIFCSTITKGTDPSFACDEISWNAFECIKFLQRTILELQEQATNQEDQLNTQSAQLNETQFHLKELQNNTVLIGFIYAQLPDQPEPHILWKTMIWTDISSQYAGLFFRVLGQGSEQFNVTQAGNSPRITRVERELMGSARRTAIDLPSTLAVTSGSYPGSYYGVYGLKFFQTIGEVRPRNSAVRIWIRSH